MLPIAIKRPWGLEVRQVLFFTLWTLFQRVRLLLHVGLDILLRKEELCFVFCSPPPPTSAFCFFEEGLRGILCPILVSLFQVKGQEQCKGLCKL